jgi:hypothetical protein
MATSGLYDLAVARMRAQFLRHQTCTLRYRLKFVYPLLEQSRSKLTNQLPCPFPVSGIERLESQAAYQPVGPPDGSE